MAELIILTGPPGAGKTTVAELLVHRFEPSVLVAGDELFGFLRRGAVEPWRSEAHDQNETVTRAAAAATGRYVEGGMTAVYDGVVGPWSLATFLAAADVDQPVHYLVLLPSEERCVTRVRGRSGHGFTDETATRHMHAAFAAAEVDSRHVLLDPPDDIDRVAALVLEAVTRSAARVDLP